MAKPPAFQWYPKDCDTDANVRAMDDAEFGFYVRCLNHAWINGGLPTDMAEFARIMHKTPKQLGKLWARVSRCFSENTEGFFVNPRLEQQRQEQESFRKSRVEAAKSKWANKSNMHLHPKADAGSMHVQCSASASASATATEIQEEPKNSANADAFPHELPPPVPSVRQAIDSSAALGNITHSSDSKRCSKIPKSIAIADEITNWYNREFYPLYPRHKARDQGLAAAKARLKTRELREQAMRALKEQLPELRSRDPIHVPYPAKWINSGSFADEPDSLFRPAVREVYQDRDQRKLAEAITMQEIMRGMYDPAKRM